MMMPRTTAYRKTAFHIIVCLLLCIFFVQPLMPSAAADTTTPEPDPAALFGSVLDVSQEERDALQAALLDLFLDDPGSFAISLSSRSALEQESVVILLYDELLSKKDWEFLESLDNLMYQVGLDDKFQFHSPENVAFNHLSGMVSSLRIDIYGVLPLPELLRASLRADGGFATACIPRVFYQFGCYPYRFFYELNKFTPEEQKRIIDTVVLHYRSDDFLNSSFREDLNDLRELEDLPDGAVELMDLMLERWTYYKEKDEALPAQTTAPATSIQTVPAETDVTTAPVFIARNGLILAACFALLAFAIFFALRSTRRHIH